MSKSDAYFQTLKPISQTSSGPCRCQCSIVTSASLRISYQYHSAPPTLDFARATANTTLHQSASQKPVLSNCRLHNPLPSGQSSATNHMGREAHRDNTEGNGYPAHRKHNVHSVQTSSFRVLKDNNHCQFKQINMSSKCTAFRQKRISTQRLLNLFVRPSAGTHVAT
jgi:hypothetical protein